MMSAKILLVEDNPITRKLMRFTLENQGFEVVQAPNATSALEEFRTGTISLVLQDLMLPDLDGFELVSQLRALPGGRTVPILAVSGLLSRFEAAKLSVGAFDDVISKPVEPHRLVQIVRGYLPTLVSSNETFGRGRTMVVIDDDPVQRKLVVRRMKGAGFKVSTAADGVEGLARIKQVTPDIIVSDVLMPRLDGFGLCVAIRRDDGRRSVPIVLVTNSYVEPADRDLALRAGAVDLVLRSPGLEELMAAIRANLDGCPAPVEPLDGMPDIEGERSRRTTRQLDRQVALNTELTQRCALLSAQLSVLSQTSEALATHDDIDDALRHALAACLDAGGVSLGALVLIRDSDLRVLTPDTQPQWTAEWLLSLFSDPDELRRASRATELTVLSRSASAPAPHRQALDRVKCRSGLLVPLSFDGCPFGTLLMMSKSTNLLEPGRAVFAQAVANQISQALAVYRAFAQKQQSEREANEQAAVMRSVLDSIAEGVVVADERGRFIHFNPAADAIMRRKSIEAPPERWSEEFGFYESDQTTPVSAQRLPMVRAMRGDSVDGMEVHLRHEGVPQGVWLNVNAKPWRDASGNIRGGVAAFRDVTREKTAQSQLMASDRMASIGLLAAGVAHGINNPLVAVLGNLEIAREMLGQSSPSDRRPLRSMIDEALHAARRVQQIVGDLKVFSRHEETPIEAVDVEDVLESTLRMAKNEVRHRARIVRDYRGAGLVKGNDSGLGQVFLNLIINAAHAIGEGKAEDNEIRVVTRKLASAKVAVEVSDTGSGIEPQHLEHLFTPLFTTKERGEGTGLGLAICERIVKTLGGEIEVESELGKGTTFRVLLVPAKDTQQEKAPLRAENRQLDAVVRSRILVLDDETTIGAVVRRAFSPYHDVITETRGDVALSRLRDDDTFDVVLCDLMMPQMTGMEFFSRLRRLRPELAPRVVFLTGGAFSPAARDFLETIDNELLDKPFNLAKLRSVVQRRLRRTNE